MKTELQDKLIEKYKDFFDSEVPIYNENNFHKLFSQKKVVVPIQFGFEVRDGWYMLLNSLMEEINQHIKNQERNKNGSIKYKFLENISRTLQYRSSHKNKLFKKLGKFIEKHSPKIKNYKLEFKITQVKEKFAGLRFYYYGGDPTIDGMVSLTESLSYQICEYCGSTINVGKTQGWFVTVCKSCFEKNPNLNTRNWKPNKNNNDTNEEDDDLF